jgi:hypothetical protein
MYSATPLPLLSEGQSPRKIEHIQSGQILAHKFSAKLQIAQKPGSFPELTGHVLGTENEPIIPHPYERRLRRHNSYSRIGEITVGPSLLSETEDSCPNRQDLNMDFNENAGSLLLKIHLLEEKFLVELNKCRSMQDAIVEKTNGMMQRMTAVEVFVADLKYRLEQLELKMIRVGMHKKGHSSSDEGHSSSDEEILSDHE